MNYTLKTKQFPNYFADNDRELVLSLIVALKKESLITNNQFIECFRNLVNSMADRETTVPKIYSYVAGE